MKISESKPRARYTLFKLEAVRLVRGGQVAVVTAKVLGILKQTLENWVRLDGKGKLNGAGGKSSIDRLNSRCPNVVDSPCLAFAFAATILLLFQKS